MTDRSKPAVLTSALATLTLALVVTVVRADDPWSQSATTADSKTGKDAKGKETATSAVLERENAPSQKEAEIFRRDAGERKSAP